LQGLPALLLDHSFFDSLPMMVFAAGADLHRRRISWRPSLSLRTPSALEVERLGAVLQL